MPWYSFPAKRVRPRYAKLADQINLAGYPVLSPEVYSPVSAYDMEFNTQPVYEHCPQTQGDLSKAEATIAQMIDMCSMKLTFIICNDDDILDIIQILEEYLGQLNNAFADAAALPPQVSAFMMKAQTFYEEIIKQKPRIYKERGLLHEETQTFSGLLGKLFRPE